VFFFIRVCCCACRAKTIEQDLVDIAIGLDAARGGSIARQFFDCLLDCCGRCAWIQFDHCCAQAFFQDRSGSIFAAQRALFPVGFVINVRTGPTQGLAKFDDGVFNIFFAGTSAHVISVHGRARRSRIYRRTNGALGRAFYWADLQYSNECSRLISHKNCCSRQHPPHTRLASRLKQSFQQSSAGALHSGVTGGMPPSR
jgi:hypothetical protein